MLADAPLVAFVPTGNLERAHAFYGGVLGLRRIESSPLANVYDAGGTMLRVTRVRSPAAAGHTVLGWRVDDLAAVMADLAAGGVRFLFYQGLEQDSDAVWTSPSGSRIVWFSDPDGNTLSLQERPSTTG
jgi:catechol 2,3-dioxygenase-like lactoylglutathione lyase family enzyme